MGIRIHDLHHACLRVHMCAAPDSSSRQPKAVGQRL